MFAHYKKMDPFNVRITSSYTIFQKHRCFNLHIHGSADYLLPMTSKPLSVGLREIANWQLDPGAPRNLQVNLPKLQRGFVWDPPRIINLWDSMLRGFPIGSLLLSEIGDSDSPSNSSDQFWLLDGQQRATSIAMGFYNPWNGHSNIGSNNDKEGWSLKVIPTLWIDLLPKVGNDEEKLFYPYLVTQSHPWGYSESGRVLSHPLRSCALSAFSSDLNKSSYTDFPLKDVFPWKANLAVPLSFVLECSFANPDNDDRFKSSLQENCKLLPLSWRSKYEVELGKLPLSHFSSFRESCFSLKKYSVNLNYLSSRILENDRTDAKDNSILFVRLNTGGIPLQGEELIFSLFKSIFPKAKDAVESAAAGFMAPSRLFSLLVRLVAAEGDHSKLYKDISLRDFKSMLSDIGFKERLEAFIDQQVAKIVATAQNLLIGSHSYRLPPALATRTLNESPDVFLAILYWLHRGGELQIESTEHRLLIAVTTALSWFGGDAKEKKENFRQWMEAAKSRPDEEFWSPETIRVLFIRDENPMPLFPNPDDLNDFLHETIGTNPKYDWENLGSTCPKHPIYNNYKHIPIAEEKSSDVELISQESVRRFINNLSKCLNALLFAQREFIEEKFKNFQQWDLVLKDIDSPWDVDHIYPSSYRKWYVSEKYRDWNNTIGNKRIEELSRNRSDGDTHPIVKLAQENTRGDSFVLPDVWEMMQPTSTNISDNTNADAICSIILRRTAEIYRKWYTTLQINQLMR